MSLRFPTHARPEASVLMVTWGRWDWPRRALRALLECSDEVPYEVIVVDNASQDETPAGLRAEVEGARLLFNDRNIGFGPAANQAALEARGDYLCFLNPDVLVRPGWLRTAIQALERPGVGAVVPRYLNPDGTLQEAGPLVDRRGLTFPLGAGADPEDPPYRFRRTIDYGSAACLVVRRSTFNGVGGFDPIYRPAYFEDVDLAFTLRARGLHTVYEPRAAVVHAGGWWSTDPARRELSERNRSVFLERWAGELSGRPQIDELDAQPHRALELRDTVTPDRVLVLADRVDGAEGLPGGLLAEIAASYLAARVTLLADAVGRPGPLLEAGVEVVAGIGDGLEGWLEERLLHYSAVITWGPAAAARGRGAVRRTQPRAISAYALDPGAGAGPSSRQGSATERRPAEVEAIRAADLVLCRPGNEEVVRAVAPGTPSLPILDRTVSERAVAEAMSFLGVAPPDLPPPAPSFRPAIDQTYFQGPSVVPSRPSRES